MLKVIGNNPYWIRLDEGNWWYLQRDNTFAYDLGDSDDWPTSEAAQDFLDNWLPPKEWLTQEQIIEVAKQGDREALKYSIIHWKQIVVAGWDEYKKAENKDLVNTETAFCALCQEYHGTPKKHPDCILYENSDITCCKEWRNLKGKQGVDFEKVAIEMLNRLIRERIKMPEEMIPIQLVYNNIEVLVPKSTIREAYEKFCKSAKALEPYQFKAADVVKDELDNFRICIKVDDELRAYRKSGEDFVLARNLEKFGYEKVGVISDFIK